MRVLIIGAGLGGLCLAHGLRTAGVEVAVFERSPRTGVQPASYGIHLNADGLRALHSALPGTNWKQLLATSMPARNVIRFHDPVNGVLATLDFETPEHATDPVTRRRAASRGNLRDALLCGLDTTDTVHFDKRFESYRTLPDTTVEATFEDGSTAAGDLLVGADGSNSRVRAQRHPDLTRQDLGILNVAGRIPLTPALARSLPPELTDSGINNVVPAGRGWMFISTWNTGDSATTAIAGDPAADRYVVWAWAAGTGTYPRRGNLNGQEFKDHVLDKTRTWSDAIHTLVRQTPAAAIGPVPLRSMPPLPEWESNRVTLLGDAIHNMTPMGGIGANTALRDAETLTRAIRSHPNAPIDAVRDYETRMRMYANQALRISRTNAERAANAAPLSRAVFRTLLRLAEAAPAVKRRVFHTPRDTVTSGTNGGARAPHPNVGACSGS